MPTIWLFVTLFLYSHVTFAQSFNHIILLTSKEGGAYQKFSDAFSEAYVNNNLSAKIKIDKLSLGDSLSLITDSTSSNTLLIAVGSKAAKAVSSLESDVALIYAMLPFSAYQNIVTENKVCSSRTAIYIDQPINRQLNLSKEIFPNLSNYGFILGEISSRRYNKEKKLHRFPVANTKGVIIKESKELSWSLRSLSQDVDVFIALNDPLVFNPNNAKWLLYMSYQERKPVIGFTRHYVSAGASASVYSTPTQLGRQTAELVLDQQMLNNNCLIKPQYPQYFKVSVNNSVVQSLSGKVVSEDLLHERLMKIEEMHK